MISMKIKGKIWLVTNASGKLIDNIDTDMIFHNAHLHITDLAEMGPVAFGNLDEWKDFPKRVGKGDIVIVGSNFGCGSSRQQAVDCFKSLGVSLIIAKSFGEIYFRNAVNSGLAVIAFPSIDDYKLEQNQELEVDLETGKVMDPIKNTNLSGSIGFSDVQKDIFLVGNLFKYAKSKN